MLTVALAAGLAACGDDSETSVADGCKPAHPDIETIKEGTLTVAGYDGPPLSKMERDKITGVDGDIVAEIAKLECLDIEPMPLAPAALIPAVEAKRADMAVGGFIRTAERTKIVNLTDPNYLDQMGIISEDGISAIPDLKGLKVGTVDGFFWVEDMKKYLGSDLKTYAAAANMYQDMETGRIDIAIDSYASGVYLAKGLKVEVAEPFDEVAASMEGLQTTFPVHLENDSLLTALNEDVAKLREDGTLAEILTANGLDPSAAEPGEPRLVQ